MRKEGTKFSPSGYIPVQWEIKNLKQFANVEYGISDPLDRTLSNGIHIIGSPNVTHDGYYVEQPIYFVSPKKVTEKFVLQKDDILFNWRSGSKKHIGKTLYCDFDELTTHVGFLLRIRVSSQEVNSRYLDSYLKFIKHREYFEKSKVQVNSSFNKEELLNLPVVVPPLPEQLKITEILITWDKAIELVDKQIETKQRLKKGLMQQLLTGKMRFPGFDDEWDSVKLGEIGDFSKGSGIRKSELLEYGIPCIRYGEIYTSHDFIIKEFYSFISLEVASTSTKIFNGDILFAGSGETPEEIGKCVAYLGEEDAYAGGDVIVLRLSKGDPRYMGYLLNHAVVNRQKYMYGQGHSVVHIYSRFLKDIEIPFPPIEEQKKIAGLLDTVDHEIDRLYHILFFLRQYKQGLMQKLLTGEVRVKV